MKLQILIPQYQESDQIIKCLFDSILNQQGISFEDIGVIVCNDGSDILLSKELIESYPFKIQYFKEAHKGVSATRNTCLAYATADYIMFCDADDELFNCFGLWTIFEEIKSGFDVLIPSFVEEVKRNNKIIYVKHNRENSFVSGKVFKRKYLVEENIKWNESLTVHEEFYFNSLSISLSNNVKYISVPYYLWKWRDDSVSRNDPYFIFKTYMKTLDCSDALITELINRKLFEQASFYCSVAILDTYYTVHKESWMKQEIQYYRVQTEKRFAEYYKKYKYLWEFVTEDKKYSISKVIENRSGKLQLDQNINEWINYVSILQNT